MYRRILLRRPLAVVSVLGMYLAPPAVAGAGTVARPVGPEFQVNSYTTGSQRDVDIGSDGAGGLVVVWASDGSAGSDSDWLSIQARRYDADGFPVGDQFQVNTYTTSAQTAPSVSANGGGGFVVVWDDLAGVKARVYDSSGSPLGDEFVVNTYAGGSLLTRATVGPYMGGFVVAWEGIGSPGTDTDFFSIQARNFLPDGSPIGDQFQVNTYTTGGQAFANVFLDDGGYWLTWSSEGSFGSDSSGHSVQGQRFGSNGSPIGNQFQVNAYTVGDQRNSSLSRLGENVVVVWRGLGGAGDDTEDWSAQGRVLDSEGVPVGQEFQVNSYTTSWQGYPVAAEARGGVAVVWTSVGSWGSDSDLWSIQGQLYRQDGVPSGNQFQVNTSTLGTQTHPALATLADDGFLVVWASESSGADDTDSWSIQGQRFEGVGIFADGFETGDSSSWSTSVP